MGVENFDWPAAQHPLRSFRARDEQKGRVVQNYDWR
jgi:hypothetical protein